MTWFYMSEKFPTDQTSIPPYTPGHERLRNLSAKAPSEHAMVLSQMLTRLSVLKNSMGLLGIDLVSSWFSRRLSPLQSRSRLLCEYAGLGDSDRTSSADWEEDELKAALNEVCVVDASTGNLVGLEPFTSSRPAPNVSRSFWQCPSSLFIYLSD